MLIVSCKHEVVNSNLCHTKKKKKKRICNSTLVSATQEGEAGGSFEPKILRPDLEMQQDPVSKPNPKQKANIYILLVTSPIEILFSFKISL
jgi:hypothetical protein